MTLFFTAIQLSMLVLAWSNLNVVAGLTLDEELKQLRINFMEMEKVLAAKDSRLESLELKVHHQGLLEAQITRLETEVNQMKAQSNRVQELKDQQQESLLHTQKGRSERNGTLRHGPKKLPRSCADLRINGHTSSGIFLVRGIKTVKTVFCDFSLVTTDPSFQTLVGFADIKSKPVSFHAQRIGSYDAINTVVPYNNMRLNVGNALNPSTGVFVAPKSGKYYFAFSGLALTVYEVKVQLQLKRGSADWIKIGDAHAQTWNTMALHSILQLSKGDQIRVFHLQGIIHDVEENNFTNFVGHLLEEDVFVP